MKLKIDKIITDNSKVNINLLKENELLKKQVEELKLEKQAIEKQLSLYVVVGRSEQLCDCKYDKQEQIKLLTKLAEKLEKELSKKLS